jgi:hypothetical protein
MDRDLAVGMLWDLNHPEDWHARNPFMR